MSDRTETAVLGGGCFWCLEAVYQLVDGVHEVKSGYAGGYTENPTYEQVCSGGTGHAEVVRVTYDPEVVSFGDLLDIFFSIHDPTTLNRQGADVGTQYRSAIFYADEAQHEVAVRKIEEVDADGPWDDPIVTEVAALERFHPAETYHDDYLNRNPSQPYCQAVVAPKVAKFRKTHFDRLKKKVVEEA